MIAATGAIRGAGATEMRAMSDRPDPPDPQQEEEELERERGELLERLEGWLDTPMVVLGFAWLALLIWETIWGLSEAMQAVVVAIWIVFIAHFLIEFVLAPRKLRYLRRNWLTAVALLVPALRAFRFVRIVRAARGIKLVRVVSSFNRSMRALGSSFNRRGFGYVVALTVTATLAGAAGMFAFESQVPGGLHSYGEALWWTSMVMTTLGSGYWPQTAEGRVLCLILSLYAFAVFGYVTATLATFFVGQDAEEQRVAAREPTLGELRAEILALRAQLGGLAESLGGARPGPPDAGNDRR
jgi:voltage-gated potassium channel